MSVLHTYYERELRFLRQFSEEFAKQYPATAGRLLLDPKRSADPHVERLIESFALLAGRVHHKLDDEFPELTDARDLRRAKHVEGGLFITIHATPSWGTWPRSFKTPVPFDVLFYRDADLDGQIDESGAVTWKEFEQRFPTGAGMWDLEFTGEE